MKPTLKLTRSASATLLILLAFTLAVPVIHAQSRVETPAAGDSTVPSGPIENKSIQQIVTDYIVKISNYSVRFLIGLTVLVFLYGLMRYMFKGASSDSARNEGKQLMIWGLVGIFVMVSVWGLVGILSSTIGHQRTQIPQFQTTEAELAPNGRKLDGTPITNEERKPDERFLRNVERQGARKYFQNLRNNGNRLYQNAQQNLNNLRDRFRNLFNRNGN